MAESFTLEKSGSEDRPLVRHHIETCATTTLSSTAAADDLVDYIPSGRIRQATARSRTSRMRNARSNEPGKPIESPQRPGALPSRVGRARVRGLIKAATVKPTLAGAHNKVGCTTSDPSAASGVRGSGNVMCSPIRS